MKGGLAVIGLIAAIALDVAAQTPVDDGFVPELAGAARVTASLVTEQGLLPRPYLDYIANTTETEQRLAMYRNGLVVVSLIKGDVIVQKKVLFPPESVTEYERVLSTTSLREVRKMPLRGNPSKLRETIRIHDAEGKFEERVYDPSTVLPAAFDRQRDVLRDLFNMVWQDRELTSPFIDYEPRAGDRLADYDLRVWTILRVHEDSGSIEVEDPKKLTRMFLKVDQLNDAFAGLAVNLPK